MASGHKKGVEATEISFNTHFGIIQSCLKCIEAGDTEGHFLRVLTSASFYTYVSLLENLTVVKIFLLFGPQFENFLLPVALHRFLA